MSFLFPSRAWVRCIVIGTAILGTVGIAQGAISVRFDQRGIAALIYNNVSLIDLDNGLGEGFQIWGYTLGDGSTGFGGSLSSWDAPTNTLTMNGNWGGTLRCQFAATTDKVTLTMTLTNPGPQTLHDINFYVAGLQFPQLPAGFGAPNYPQFHNGVDGPNLIPADFGGGLLVLASEDAKLMTFGLTPSGAADHYFWVVGSQNDRNSTGFLGAAAPFVRPIPPGGSDTYAISLRFAASGTDYRTISGDVLTAFGQAWPQTLHWTDRRPIGELFMTAPTNSPIPDGGPNPRNYSTASNIDIRTQAGQDAFHQSVLAYADNAVQIVKNEGGQGVILWDMEGQQFKQDGGEGTDHCGGVPGEMSYVGSPDMLPQISPEMDSVADAFFKKFTDAGLRCGMTLRPQRPVLAGSGSYQDWCITRSTQTSADILVQKVQYAYNRWGCTLFYVDSDGGPLDSTSSQVWSIVNQTMPNVLMIPENICVKDSAYSAPLASFTAPYKPLHTPAVNRQIWPNAASVTYVGDAPNSDLRNNRSNGNQWNEFVQAVRAGDILSFRGWFDDEPLNGQVKQIYSEAGVGTPPPPPTGSACDLNGDGQVNVTDVQNAVNQVLSVTTCTNGSLHQDGQCTVSDVQRVVNTVLGGVCLTGQ